MRQPLGQHFLRDQSVIQTIVAAAELSPAETALEIGPGKGVLTDVLLPRVKALTAVELDADLAASLQTRYMGHSKLQIVRSDFLKTDLDQLFPPHVRPIKILGNLPYAVTSPIIEKILAWEGWQQTVFLIQLEVAERIRSLPGSKTFGILSLAVQLFADAELLVRVKPGAFKPPPEVTSAVIRLRRKAQPELPADQVPVFFDLAHGAFAHRRKTLANSLALHSGLAKGAVEEWLRAQAVDPKARAEQLGLKDYVRLAEKWGLFRRENEFDKVHPNVYNTRRFSD